jgi:shikimate kinase
MNIYIIGFMATGKSAVGRKLARLLDREFVDLDDYIEKKAGKPVVEIFRDAGEPFFRILEREVLAQVALRDRLVIACGGGTVIDGANVAVMKRTGRIVCLTASPGEIEKRSGHSDKRPLLNAGEKRAAIEDLIAKRHPLYCSAADITVDTTSLSVDEAADAVLGFVRADSA